MDLGKLRGSPGESNPPEGSSKDLPSTTPSRSSSKGAKNVTETRAWKEGMGGVRRMWSNYLKILSTSFQRMTRDEQEQLITRMCQVITIGCAIVLTTFFYQFVPTLIRIFALPAFIVGSYFVATRVVSPIIIAQFENKLNPN